MLGRKAELAEKAYYAWKLKLEVSKTTQEEEGDVSARRREKLTIESGQSIFLFPTALKKDEKRAGLTFSTFWRMR